MTRKQYTTWLEAVKAHHANQGNTVSIGELQQENGKFLTKIFINGQKSYAGFDGYGYSVWR